MSFGDKPPHQLSLGNSRGQRSKPSQPEFTYRFAEFEGDPQTAFRPKPSMGFFLD